MFLTGLPSGSMIIQVTNSMVLPEYSQSTPIGICEANDTENLSPRRDGDRDCGNTFLIFTSFMILQLQEAHGVGKRVHLHRAFYQVQQWNLLKASHEELC